MSALHEWYRYVDSLVRPSRRFEELEEWWVPEDLADEPEEPAADCGLRIADCGTAKGVDPSLSDNPQSAIRNPRSTGPPPIDAGTVVARLAAYRPEQPAPVEWSLHRGECSVPELAQFIPALGSTPEVGAAARAFQEIVERAQAALAPPAPGRSEPRPADVAPTPVEHPAAPRAHDRPSLEDEHRAGKGGSEPDRDPGSRSPVVGEPLRQSPPSRKPHAGALATASPVEPTAQAPAGNEPEEPRPRMGHATAGSERDGAGSVPAAAVTLESPSGDSSSEAPSSLHHALPLPEASLPDADPSTDTDAPPAPGPGLAERIPVGPAAAVAGERFDLPTIGAIREGLPRTMERLLQIPITEEVAQNSYKSPFRETREELIQRLFDPPLTLEEAARILGVCPTTVRRYTNKGLLHHYRTQGNQRRFRLSDLLEFLEQWGDAGPDAGALGGSASSRRGKSERPRPPRAARPSTGGDKDAEQTEPAVAAADA